MQKKRNEIWTIIKNDILNNVKIYFIILVIYGIGVMFGVLFVNQTQDKTEITKYINTYIDENKSIQNIDYVSALEKDIKDNILLVVLLWFSGTTVIGIPIVLGIILYRGFCLGYTIASCAYVLGKIKALFFICITLLLQNLFFIPAIIILGVSSIKLYKSIIKDRRRENIKLCIIKHTILSLIILMALIVSSIIKIEISYRIMFSVIKYF